MIGAVLVPGTILYVTGPDTFGLWRSSPASRFVLPIVGSIFFGIGLILFVATIWLFATVGKGTAAPWNPPQRLVVEGVYRHVRNPMISAATLLLLGEALISASAWLVGLVCVVVVVNLIYIPLSEEPGLVRRFGDEYLLYKRNVPRWIPRMKPWDGK